MYTLELSNLVFKSLLHRNIIMEDLEAPKVIRFDGDIPIAEFLCQWRPSNIPFEHFEWIHISTAYSRRSDAYLIDTPGLALAWEDLCLNSLERLTTSHIEELAKKHNVLHGKWLIFVDTNQVDDIWEVIAKAVINNGLAIEAKVSTLHPKPKNVKIPKEEKIPNRKHVMCVWSENFTLLDDVFALRDRLRALGFSSPIGYKPDAYSICGVYQGNSLGLSPIKFCS
jgi:hypothetical protein